MRDDPRFNGQPHQVNNNSIQPSIMQNPETYVKYPIPIGTIQNQGNDNSTQRTQSQQVDKGQQQHQVKKNPDQLKPHSVQEELYLQMIRQQQEQLKALQEQNQMLRQQQWQQQITELQNNSQMKDKKTISYKKQQITNGILRPKQEETSVQGEVSQLVNEVDRPVFVNHYYVHLKDSAVNLPTKAKLVYIIEGDEHSSLSSKGVQSDDTPRITGRPKREGDEHSTPSSHTVATGKNRVREAEEMAVYGNQATLLQKTKTHVTPQETVIVQPAMGQNNPQP